ncbi:MAG: type III-B CRISPR-associated protein Cas10/Cmr2 [Spirulinaceae cyanobacterium SM2_1_0]|nr:type III-B CRISPR-associated protein Cas10/Cmr2 [Spirulinaceae cyanobacterium SM2_1_0]
MPSAATPYWQAKIWGLLHDPALKALRPTQSLSDEGPWDVLDCMTGWASPKDKNERKNNPYSGKWLTHLAKCDTIASASDRTSIGRLPNQVAVAYSTDESVGLRVSHLFSGEPQKLHFDPDKVPQSGRADTLRQVERAVIPEAIRTCGDPRQVFWWFWRCYPAAIAKRLDERIHLLPADTRIPDASLWSHTATTAALAGGLAGRYADAADYPLKNDRVDEATLSRPTLLNFTFTPIQQFVQASRKLRDLWASSWLLHFLSARACWELAWTYGPDALLYPCLYAQPLIDYWLLEQYSHFRQWIDPPSDRALLTAGFPNVVVTILPDNGDRQGNNPVKAAAQQLQSALNNRWQAIAAEALDWLQKNDRRSDGWQNVDQKLWQQWLKAQWQPYWVTFPLGAPEQTLDIQPTREDFDDWCKGQNAAAMADLLREGEASFVKVMFNLMPDQVCDEESGDTSQEVSHSSKATYKKPNLNVGSWWADIFDTTRLALNTAKNARNWTLPTAFGPRSTISGFGPVARSPENPANNWVTEAHTRKFWAQQLGIFNGSEQLNPSETTKRLLPRLLSRGCLLGQKAAHWRDAVYQPDLSAGVAGWLHSLHQADEQQYQRAKAKYQQACADVCARFDWVKRQEIDTIAWGIPWVDGNDEGLPNPRLLNAGWLADDFETNSTDERTAKRGEIRDTVSQTFRGNNPTDWYAIAQGDGDGMRDWLKGTKLDPYRQYLPETLLGNIDRLDPKQHDAFEKFIDERKRMGPATHAAFSRALLDFSNQLVPYLTEDRYAGRLIYSGGDDVLAYTNLWEWDRWLWDIRECFRGSDDPQDEFASVGHYWTWRKSNQPPAILQNRPLFTLGSKATISFGIVIANQSVPLAIALEELRAAEGKETGAKAHVAPDGSQKDAVQVRVIYGNGNILKATAKFDTFNCWRSLLDLKLPSGDLEPALFEQAAQLHDQHPIPLQAAIAPWTQAFCQRRDALQADQGNFQTALQDFLEVLWITTTEGDRDDEIKKWLKLAAFVLRNRHILDLPKQSPKTHAASHA